MNMRDPGEKGENFKAVIFSQKLFFDAEIDGEFNGAIFIFLCCILWSENEFENCTYGHFRSFWTI